MFTSIRKYKVTRGSAEDLARRVQRVSNQTANLQTNELSAKERLNGWLEDGGHDHDMSDLTKYQDPAWPFGIIADGVSRAQAAERT